MVLTNYDLISRSSFCRTRAFHFAFPYHMLKAYITLMLISLCKMGWKKLTFVLVPFLPLKCLVTWKETLSSLAPSFLTITSGNWTSRLSTGYILWLFCSILFRCNHHIIFNWLKHPLNKHLFSSMRKSPWLHSSKDPLASVILSSVLHNHPLLPSSLMCRDPLILQNRLSLFKEQLSMYFLFQMLFWKFSAEGT